MCKSWKIRFCFEHNFEFKFAEWHANYWSLHKFCEKYVKRRKSVKCGLIKEIFIAPSYRQNWPYSPCLTSSYFWHSQLWAVAEHSIVSTRNLNLIIKCEVSFFRAILPAKFASYIVSHDNRWMEFFYSRSSWPSSDYVLTAGDCLAVDCSCPHLRQRLARSPALYQFLYFDVCCLLVMSNYRPRTYSCAVCNCCDWYAFLTAFMCGLISFRSFQFSFRLSPW